MFKRGGGEPDISNGAVQRGMREEIVGRLDKIIDNWDPAFAKLASDTKLASDLARDAELALEALKQARSELSGMIFPRTDRAVGSCYQSLLEQTDLLLKAHEQMSFAGDGKICSAADAVRQAVSDWCTLN